MYDGKDTIVIFDKLAYEDLLPVRWRPYPQQVDDVTAQHFAERNLRVLQACDALEEHGQLDKKDDEAPHSADLRRLDFKLNLLLDLAGQLLAQSQPRLKPSTIRLNAMGASFTYDDGLVEGAYGVLEVMLRDIVVQPLNLPAQVVSGAPQGQTRVRFLSLGEVVADHIEKLVFRRHRRKIAGARGARRA
ncbi:MAG TPA: PilZ domain-containing protein [Steroidobacteraceae bacterium]|nr:PilZ domain-containing protein [Steroidobacteraceae bacterium]